MALQNNTYLCAQEYIKGNLKELSYFLTPASSYQSPALTTRVMREFAPYASGY